MVTRQFSTMSTSSGFMKRASAIVVDRPCAARLVGGLLAFARRVPNDNSAILVPSRTMRPLPISSGMPTSGISTAAAFALDSAAHSGGRDRDLRSYHVHQLGFVGGRHDDEIGRQPR